MHMFLWAYACRSASTIYSTLAELVSAACIDIAYRNVPNQSSSARYYGIFMCIVAWFWSIQNSK